MAEWGSGDWRRERLADLSSARQKHVDYTTREQLREQRMYMDEMRRQQEAAKPKRGLGAMLKSSLGGAIQGGLMGAMTGNPLGGAAMGAGAGALGSSGLMDGMSPQSQNLMQMASMAYMRRGAGQAGGGGYRGVTSPHQLQGEDWAAYGNQYYR